MPGVIAISQGLTIGSVLEDLVLVVTCSDREELAARVLYLPLR